MYDFSGDYETFFTGETDSSTGGLYDTFRGSTDLPHWNGKHCSNIQNASDGTKFKSFVEDDEKLLFFRKSMCRPQRLVSLIFKTSILELIDWKSFSLAIQVRTNSNVDTVQGLKAVRYQFEEHALDNGIHNEENKCACRGGKCNVRFVSEAALVRDNFILLTFVCANNLLRENFLLLRWNINRKYCAISLHNIRQRFFATFYWS